MVNLSDNDAPLTPEDIDDDLRAGDGNEFGMDLAALGTVDSDLRMQGALALLRARDGIADARDAAVRDETAKAFTSRFAWLIAPPTQEERARLRGHGNES